MPRISAEREQGRRLQILEAAVSCFSRQGFRATSVDDIVRESGLSVGAIYKYFSSKEDVFVAVAEQRTQAILGQLRALFDQPGPMLEKTQQAAELLFAEMTDEDGRYARMRLEFWTEANRSERLEEQRSRLCGASREFVRWLLLEARRRGELRANVDIAASTELLIALGDGLLMNHAAGVSQVPIPRLRQAYVDFLNHALAPRESLFQGVSSPPRRSPNGGRTAASVQPSDTPPSPLADSQAPDPPRR